MRSQSLLLFQTSSLLSYAALLLILLVPALVVALSVSGRLAAFGEAFDHFVTELFRAIANRLQSLQERLRAFASDAPNAGKFFSAILCLVVAVAVAVANYHVLLFSFELLLPVGDALTTAAITYVSLRAIAGILIHFLDKGAARRIVIATILVASLCATTLAYMRAAAMTEVSNDTTLIDSNENVVRISPNLAEENNEASEPVEPAAEPITADSEWLFGLSLEGLIVAAIALIIDTFELLCIFGALKLSIAGVVWFVCLPVRLPLVITKETFGLIHQTGLAALISTAVRALLETPKIIVLGSVRALKKLSLFTITKLKKGVVALWKNGRLAIVLWRKRHIHQARRRAVLNRVLLREENRQAAIRSGNAYTDDYRASMRRSYQLENTFAEQELTADLEHRAQINRALRAKGFSILAQNLEEVELVFDDFSAQIKQGVLANSQAHGTAAADDLATTVAHAITAQYQRMSEPPVIPSKHVTRLDPALRKNGNGVKSK